MSPSGRINTWSPPGGMPEDVTKLSETEACWRKYITAGGGGVRGGGAGTLRVYRLALLLSLHPSLPPCRSLSLCLLLSPILPVSCVIYCG